MKLDQLDFFFRPRSVAVVGASRNPQKIGHVIFRNFLEESFRGAVFPVNPNAEEIFGRRCYPSVTAIPGRVELAVISIPAPAVPACLEECGRKRIPAVIIISGGFKEVGNVELEEKVRTVLKKHRTRAIGANCVGIFDPATGVDTFFLPRYKLERPGAGDIAFISQSGALGSVVLDWMAMKGYKISKFISYGNATDVDEADLIEYLGRDPKTKVICCYFEGLSEGRRFFEICRKVAKRKPVIVIKGGQTDEGTKAVSSHTGSMAGEARIASAAFRQAGAIEARTLEQLFDYARVLATQPRPKGNRVLIITDGGGFGVLTADWLVSNGLSLAAISKPGEASLRKQFPPHVVIKNPMDLTGDADVDRYRQALDYAIGDPGTDMVAVITLFQIPTLSAEIVDVVASYAEKRDKPVIVIAAGGRFTEVLKKTLEDNGVPTFSYPEKAADALGALWKSSEKQPL
jgi:acetyl coenzyme A synthetase (ADP forming)-like protein